MKRPFIDENDFISKIKGMTPKKFNNIAMLDVIPIETNNLFCLNYQKFD